jgi:small GTP-binding protein
MSANKKDQCEAVKIIVAGEGGVGKTSLLDRFVNNHFNLKYKLTIGVDFFSKHCNVNGLYFRMVFWDFGGQKRFRDFLDGYIKGARGAIFMFDLTRIESLEFVEDWVNMLRKNEKIPIILIGTKLDLVRNKNRLDCVPSSYINDIKEHYNFLDYFETSAKSDMNINSAFEVLLKRIIEKDILLSQTEEF